MLSSRLITWPRIAYPILTGLIISGAIIFVWLVVFDDPPSAWSRWALGLQVGALALALGLLPWHPSGRFVVYPLLLAGLVYVWDFSLPPPSLPAGFARQLVPRLVLVGLLADLVITLRRRPHPPPAAPEAEKASAHHAYIEGYNRGYEGGRLPRRVSDAYLHGWQEGRKHYHAQYGQHPKLESPNGSVLLLLVLGVVLALLLAPGSGEWLLLLILRLLSGRP